MSVESLFKKEPKAKSSSAWFKMITDLPISHKLTDWSPQVCDSNAGTEPSHIGGLVSSKELGSDFMTFVFTYFALSVFSEYVFYILLQLNEFDEASTTKKTVTCFCTR